jgi:hypothetical protein
MNDGHKAAWRRVSRSHPCPVCGHADWCLVAAGGAAAICPRVESGKRAGDAGYLHRLMDRQSIRRDRVVCIRHRSGPPDFGPLAARCVQNCEPTRLAGLARSLGVSAEALAALSVGWYAGGAAWSWPMTDPAAGRVIGIRLRRPDGTKYAVRGGRDGLFLPATPPGPTDGLLLVCEGPTDTAAALTLGYARVVGGPSCAGGTRSLVALVRDRHPTPVAVVADGDGPGRDGARRLAAVLRLHCLDVRVVVPPAGAKDLRAWVAAGATRADMDRAIAAAAPWPLTVRVTFRGRRR